MMPRASQAGWWNTDPATNGAYAVVTRVVTSQTRSRDTLPATDSGYDYPDADAAITAAYGGEPFVVGYPVQISVYIAAVTGGWDWVALQYATGTNAPGAESWSTIATLTQVEHVVGIDGCHFGHQWTPPTLDTNYLVRIVGKPTLGTMLSANTNAPSIGAKGDNLTWANHQVVGFFVRGNKRPGSR